MTPESHAKLETILISCINRLYSKEEQVGLDLEDLRALDIIFKIAKDTMDGTSKSAVSSTTESPANLIDLLRAARGLSSDGQD